MAALVTLDDYAALDERPEPQNPLKKVARFAALLAVGTSGYVLSQATHLFTYSRPRGGAGSAFVPKEGVQGALMKTGPGEPGMGQLVPPSALKGPSALFVYTKASLPAELMDGATVEEGWVYGAKLQSYGRLVRGRSREEMVVSTGVPGDIVKGKLLDWGGGSFADKLRACDHLCQADKLHGYDVTRPNHGTLRRGVTKVVRKDGSTEKAWIYYQDLSPASAPAAAAPVVPGQDMTASGGRPPNKYDVHLYYSALSKSSALAVRDKMKAAFPWLRFFDPKDAPLGPHPLPMWECDFLNSDQPDKDLGDVMAWLMLNREGHSVLVHPQTGDGPKDHTEHAVWLGKPLQLKLELLKTPTKVFSEAGLAFEVFGKVQGVSFRTYTKEKASSLKLRGSCLNTPQGTVKGEAYGSPSALAELKSWLENKGSPRSIIERTVFSDLDVSKGDAYKTFQVIRD